MKNSEKHEFDEIFRAGLTAPDLSEVDQDWTLMKARLQSKNSRKIIPYYMILVASIAALFVLVFAMFFNSPKVIPTDERLTVKNDAQDQLTPVVSVPATVENTIRSIQKNSEVKRSNLSEEIAAPIYSSNFAPPTATKQSAEYVLNNTGNPALNTPALQSDTSASTTASVSPIQPARDSSTSVIANEAVVEKPFSLADVNSVKSKKETLQTINSAKSRLSLSINFAPDLNGVKQFQSDKVSYSIGAGLIYTISKKLSIEAGAAYGKKNYQTGFSSFRPASYNLFLVKPNVVSSGFDVMDIQLNLAYTVMQKGRSSIGLGAGLSSYLMLDEQYSFTYQNRNASGLSSFHTGYQNNHFMGIANLNVSYKRSLTNHVKLAINPYLKLPLTDLGYGNIRLRSAGISVGVITSLNKRTK